MAEGTPRDPSQVETSFTAGAVAASIVIGAILGGFVGASDAANHHFGDAADVLSDEGRERCLAWCEGFTRAVPDDLLVGASFIDRP